VAKRRCKGLNKQGEPCKAAPLKDRDVCLAHAEPELREKTGFVPDNGKGGRPRQPRPTELLREKMLELIDPAVDAIRDALEAERAIVVGSGEHAEVELVPDHPVRTRAAQEVFDRTAGKPAQAVEVTGADGGAVEVEAATDHETRELAHKLLERMAHPKQDDGS
jgi:hypothetical protein